MLLLQMFMKLSKYIHEIYIYVDNKFIHLISLILN